MIQSGIIERHQVTARYEAPPFFLFTFETLRPSGIVTNPTLGERAPLLCTKFTEKAASIPAPCPSRFSTLGESFRSLANVQLR